MNDYLYIIIIIGFTIFIIFYGGHNLQNKIEYDIDYFENLNLIILFEKKLQNITNQFNFSASNFYNINEVVNISHNIIPNFKNCFYIQIKPFELFNVTNIIDHDDFKTHIMILFNHNKHNNIELLINNHSHDLYRSKINSSSYSHDNNIGYFYRLNKIISVVDIYHIFNNSSDNVFITCFIIKKPFWHK
jgi:hypothetical protein